MKKLQQTLLLIMLVTLFSCKNRVSDENSSIFAQSQTEKQNKQIVTRYFEEVINQQKITLIPQLFTEEFVYYDLHNFSETKDSVKSFQEVMRGFFKAFPDAHYTVKNMIAEDDKVFAEIILTATHKGDFMGIAATNKPLKISETYLLIISKDKISESRRLVDFSAFFEQLNSK